MIFPVIYRGDQTENKMKDYRKQTGKVNHKMCGTNRWLSLGFWVQKPDCASQPLVPVLSLDPFLEPFRKSLCSSWWRCTLIIISPFIKHVNDRWAWSCSGNHTKWTFIPAASVLKQRRSERTAALTSSGCPGKAFSKKGWLIWDLKDNCVFPRGAGEAEGRAHCKGSPAGASRVHFRKKKTKMGKQKRQSLQCGWRSGQRPSNTGPWGSWFSFVVFKVIKKKNKKPSADSTLFGAVGAEVEASWDHRPLSKSHPKTPPSGECAENGWEGHLHVPEDPGAGPCKGP